jgi:hypothetical protein
MKSFRYKNWLCKWVEKESIFLLYTPDETEKPPGCRHSEWECYTKEECIQFINSY